MGDRSAQFHIDARLIVLTLILASCGKLQEPRPASPNAPVPKEVIDLSPTITEETKSKEALDLPWNVVVHNDPVNLMSYVTMVFQKVFGYPREKAEMHMMEVHQKGRSILWSGVRERAELFVQQLHGYLLLATIERTN